jgi:uncharacterized SAM-binding protein YcdF (DUF218 family)
MLEDVVKYFILPSNLIIIFSVLGVIFFLVKKTRKSSIYLLLTSLAIYIIFATGPVSFWLLGTLEYEHPYIERIDAIKDIEYIVVLTAFAEEDSLLPLSSRLNDASAFRLLEVLSIFNDIPHSNIIITGNEEPSFIMKEMLISAGINQDKIIIENNSDNTFESAINVNALINNKPFILITSAGHMPRTIRVFNKLGMRPTPAPTHYLTKKNNLAISYLPSPLHLRYSDLAIHEYAGILWYRLTNRI